MDATATNIVFRGFMPQASLKLSHRVGWSGLDEAGFPRLYAAASLKLRPASEPMISEIVRCFPRLYAAASLKLLRSSDRYLQLSKFSAALCRGLIEAARKREASSRSACGFPRLYAAASLKRDRRRRVRSPLNIVFRGFMPRPH